MGGGFGIIDIRLIRRASVGLIVRAASPVACALFGITDIRLLEDGVAVLGRLGRPVDLGVPLEKGSASACRPFGVKG